jgi:DNA-binding response OmpR family regulator
MVRGLQRNLADESGFKLGSRRVSSGLQRMSLGTETNEALIRRIGSLEQLIGDLRQSMSIAGALPSEWRLTPKERDLILALIANETVTKEMAKVVLYGTDAADRPDHTIDVFLSRIRRKTRDHAVTIETINRTGYRLVDRLVWAKALKLGAVAEH